MSGSGGEMFSFLDQRTHEAGLSVSAHRIYIRFFFTTLLMIGSMMGQEAAEVCSFGLFI